MIALLYLLKVTVVVLTAAMIVAFAGQRVSAGTRHFICTLAIGGLLALPFMSWALPDAAAISLPVIAETIDESIVDPLRQEMTRVGAPAGVGSVATHLTPLTTNLRVYYAERPIGTLSEIPWRIVLLVVYASGVCLLLVRLAVEHLTVQRLLRRATEMATPEWQTEIAPSRSA